ncbi:MAG TPA: 5'-nucleotidase C-terminal domain-containing protein [Opitutus sp.]|nr:5'-nucleotidase C-terminal domain-containing protein [Opitutus sp.]
MQTGNRRGQAAVIVAGLVAVMATAAPRPEAIFVAIGDQHSACERTAQFVARVDRVRAENPGVPLAVLIDGDVFEGGNVVAQRSGGAVDFAMLRALAERTPTVLDIGNHEAEFFDLAETVARARAAGVIVIGGNAVDRASGKPFAPASTRLPLGTHEAVIVGVMTDQLATYRAAVRPTLQIEDPRVWAGRNLPALLDHAAVPVVLSHAGLEADRAILAMVPDGTLYVGAHNHLLLVHRIGRTLYLQSGSWTEDVSVVRLFREDDGRARWEIEQEPVAADGPADPALAKLIAETRAKYLTPDDLAPVGRLPAALGRDAAARFVVAAVRRAAGADAAFIGNTTFGGGLPAGAVSRVALNGCVRFDGAICVAEVTGEQLREFLHAANQGPDTPFAIRRGEFQYADGPAPAAIAPDRTYRIATTDWGMKNRGRYFGTEAIAFAERPELRLKAIVVAALQQP